MEKIGSLKERLMKLFANLPHVPEPHYDCKWCHDSGYVECYTEHGRNYPIKLADVLRTYQEKRGCYFVMAPCGFCEAGTYRGRPTACGIKSAERWVKENVTSVSSLNGTYKIAEEEGYSEEMINQAFQRLGIRKYKISGKWVCEPAA